MTEHEFKMWVINEVVGKSRSRTTIMRRLREKGFKFFASGDYKLAYRHTEHPNHLVKVYREHADEQEDSSDDVPFAISEFYLHPIHRTDNYMIQEFANGHGGAGIDAYRWFLNNANVDSFDLHSGNCRYHNGVPVIIDFCS